MNKIHCPNPSSGFCTAPTVAERARHSTEGTDGADITRRETRFASNRPNKVPWPDAGGPTRTDIEADNIL